MCVIFLSVCELPCALGNRDAPSFSGEDKPRPPVAQVDEIPGLHEGKLGGTFVKIVALVPVRDEAHLLPSCLRSLAPLVHATVVLDDCSTDGSGDVARAHAEECKVERIARSPNCSNGMVISTRG